LFKNELIIYLQAIDFQIPAYRRQASAIFISVVWAMKSFSSLGYEKKKELRLRNQALTKILTPTLPQIITKTV